MNQICSETHVQPLQLSFCFLCHLDILWMCRLKCLMRNQKVWIETWWEWERPWLARVTSDAEFAPAHSSQTKYESISWHKRRSVIDIAILLWRYWKHVIDWMHNCYKILSKGAGGWWASPRYYASDGTNNIQKSWKCDNKRHTYVGNLKWN